MEAADCVVVGAGVVGLAVARTLAAAGREVLVLEAEAHVGEHTSSRNSEVIHAGLYYKKGSLRQQLFPRAAHLLYAYCASHGAPHRRIGKLVVARSAEEARRLRQHMAHATEAGVRDLEWLEPHQAQKLEPNLACHAAYPVAVVRHRRQSRADAGLSGRTRGSRRSGRVPLTRDRRGHNAGRHRDKSRWRRAHDAPLQDAGKLRRPRRAAARQSDCEFPRRQGAAQLFSPRRLFQCHGASVHAARSIRSTAPAAWTFMRSSTLPAMCGSVRTCSGWTASIIRSIRRARRRSIARSVSFGRVCPTALFRPLMRVSGRKSPAPTNRRPTSSSRARPTMASQISLICSASESPGLTSSLAIGEYVAGLLGLAAPVVQPAYA